MQILQLTFKIMYKGKQPSSTQLQYLEISMVLYLHNTMNGNTNYYCQNFMVDLKPQLFLTLTCSCDWNSTYITIDGTLVKLSFIFHLSNVIITSFFQATTFFSLLILTLLIHASTTNNKRKRRKILHFITHKNLFTTW